MSKASDLRLVLEAIRRHVERAAAGTGLQPNKMTVDLRFGLMADEHALVKPVLRTAGNDTAAPHSLRMTVLLTEGTRAED